MSVLASSGVQWGAGFAHDNGQGMDLPDQYGNDMAFLTLSDNAWHDEVGDLSPYAGGQVQELEFAIQAGTVAGAADVWMKDVTIVHADGSVTPILTSGQISLNAYGGSGVTTSPQSVCAGSNLTLYYTPVEVATAEATNFYFSDHLGSAQMEFASGGWPVSFSQFAPFGGELDGQISANHYKFTGKERDTESGLDYFGARYYGSNMGRFMSPDWADKAEPVPYADLDNPQSLNLYGYVKNNPLSQSDPDGHCCEWAKQKLQQGKQWAADHPRTVGAAIGLAKVGIGVAGVAGTIAAAASAEVGTAGVSTPAVVVLTVVGVQTSVATAVKGITEVVGAATNTPTKEATQAVTAVANPGGQITTAITGDVNKGAIASGVTSVAAAGVQGAADLGTARQVVTRAAGGVVATATAVRQNEQKKPEQK